MYPNGVKGNQSKVEDSEIKAYSLCFGNISKDFAIANLKKIRLNGCVYDFFLDYSTINAIDISDIYKYLIKKHDK